MQLQTGAFNNRLAQTAATMHRSLLKGLHEIALIVPGPARTIRTAFFPVIALLLAAGGAGSAAAQDFPNRMVRIIVGFGPGGSSDVSARFIADRLSEEWKQPVIVENKPGAGTTLAASYVASSAADGYTLLLISPGTHATSGALYKNLSYDVVKSFAGIGLIATAPFVIVVPESSPVKTLKDLIERAKAKPGEITYSTGGAGTGPHLVTEVIAQSTGAVFLHIPFRGSAAATTALLAKQVDFSTAEASASTYVESGEMRGLAVTTGSQSALFKGIPTVAETAVANFAYPLSVGLAAPAGTPVNVIAKINTSLNRALAHEDTRKRMHRLGFEPGSGTPQQFDELLATEAAKYRKIVKDVGLKID